MIRQSPDDAKIALTMNATRMPSTIISWFSDETAPRISVGAISDRYSGTTSAADPTARPITKRAAISTPVLGAVAATSAPTVKVTPAMTMSGLRPSRSDNGPASAAPVIAPSSSTATTAPCQNGDRPKSVLMNRIAPEMTPVS
jgi:hypothetical protein